jgi:hypothetical protein
VTVVLSQPPQPAQTELGGKQWDKQQENGNCGSRIWHTKFKNPETQNISFIT